MKTVIAGYPRIGAHRELKFRTEAFLRGEITEQELLAEARDIRRINRMTLKEKGISSIPSNDFSLYDAMLDTATLIGAIPARYRNSSLSPLERYFAMARGNDSADLKALTMRKWFNTNYHYMVSCLDDDTVFSLEGDKLFMEYREALDDGIVSRPFIIGPFTFLSLSSYTGKRMAKDFVSGISSVYRDILARCTAEKIPAVAFGESALVTDLTGDDTALFTELYRDIFSTAKKPAVYLHTSFGDIRDCWDEVMSLPFSGIALDFVEGTENLRLLEERGFPADKELTAGIINGKNVWKCDQAKTLALIGRIASLSGCTGENGRLSLGTSCSLLHIPISLTGETGIDPAVRSRLSFAEEKLDELAWLASGARLAEAVDHSHNDCVLVDSVHADNAHANNVQADSENDGSVHTDPVQTDNVHNDHSHIDRRHADHVHVDREHAIPDAQLSRNIAALSAKDWTRHPSRAERKAIQRARFSFPALPTTTIGSFPQTDEVRHIRTRFKRGEIDEKEYSEAIRKLTANCIALQEDIGLDVLAHGEFERTDMVEFFGQNLEGFAFTLHGWVQSYGTRCVKPPIIVSDISRKKPLTVDLAVYAQSLSRKPVKGMLTGPVTILNWSFPREDITLREAAFQIAAAIREEVLDLEKNGISIIQIDEAALREKMPLRHEEREEKYLDWAIPSFRYCASGVRSDTQIHTHMCYSDFADCIQAIDALDADVITFEAARSNLSILDALADVGFDTDVGPGVYDIHSPRVPPVAEIEAIINTMLEKLGKAADRYDGLWVNPDCGLKTREKAETEASLRNLIKAVKKVRHAHSSGA